MKRKAREPGPVKKALLWVLLAAVGVTTVVPLVWMINTSLKGEGDRETDFWAGHPTLGNYVRVFHTVPFGRFYLNSMMVAVVVTVGQLVTSALAAYAFARLDFPGRNKIFFAYLATMMVPGAVTMVPRFVILTGMPVWLNGFFGTTWFTDERFFFGKWFAGVPLGADSYFVLIVPALFSPYGTFLLRQFFLAIPKELDEAAMIDGASRLGIFRHVIVPMSKPALATLGTFTFMGCWGNFLWPLIMTNSSDMQTLPVGLAAFMDQYTTNWPLLMAGAVMSVIPMIIVFLLFQRWFVSGIQLGAVKG
jgi:multiple sugar transport system permease protein